MEEQYAEMDQLLYTWNLPQLCEIFREQEITPDALDALTDDDIVALIPKLGPRAVFRKRLTEWLKSAQNSINSLPQAPEIQQTHTDKKQTPISYAFVDEDDNEVEVLSEVWLNDDMSAGDAVVEDEQSNQIDFDEPNENIEQYYEKDAIESTKNIDIEDEKPILSELKKTERPKRPRRVEDYKNLTKNAFSEKKSVKLKIDGIKVEASTSKYAKTTLSESITEAINHKDDEQDVEKSSRHCQRIGHNWAALNVEELLLSSEAGRALIENYESNPILDKRARYYLADIIITETFAKNLIMDRFKFNNIADQIVQLFPTEEKESWYIQQKSKKCSGGTLYYKYYAVYTKMRRNGFYQHYVDSISKHFDSDASLSAEIENSNYSIKLKDIGDDPDKTAFKRSIPRYERMRNSSDFERINVKEILEKSYEGLAIIDFYEKNSTLDVTTRNRLCKLVCMEGINRNIKMQPCDFYDISCQVVELFPNEKHEMYFFPRGKTPPKGCLYHKYIYLIRRMKKMGLVKKDVDNADV